MLEENNSHGQRDWVSAGLQRKTRKYEENITFTLIYIRCGVHASAGCRERRATICGGRSSRYGYGSGCTTIQNYSMGDGLPMGLRRPSTFVHITHYHAAIWCGIPLQEIAPIHLLWLRQSPTLPIQYLPLLSIMQQNALPNASIRFK